MRTMKMKSLFLIGMCGVLSVLHGQNDSATKSIDILPWDQTNLQNEICIQNFFPMFFNSWGGGSSVMYRRYFKSGKYAVRAKIDGTINDQNRNAFNNGDLAVAIPDEFNVLKYSSSNVNLSLGFQYRFVNQKGLTMYSFADLSFGQSGYIQSSANATSTFGTGKGRTILSFYKNEYSSSSKINSFGLGIGAQLKVYKSFYAGVESAIQITSMKTTVNRIDRQVEYNVGMNKYFEASKNETTEPMTTMVTTQLTPATVIYLTYRF